MPHGDDHKVTIQKMERFNQRILRQLMKDARRPDLVKEYNRRYDEIVEPLKEKAKLNRRHEVVQFKQI